MSKVVTRNKMTKAVGGFIILVSSALFLFIAYLISKEPVLKIDTFVFSWSEKVEKVLSSDLMTYITHAGSPFIHQIFAIFIGLLLMFIKRDVFASLFIMIVPIGGIFLNRAIKRVFQRERPSINPDVEGTGFSFPSGHATGSIVFYGCLIYLMVRSQFKSKVKWTFSSMLALLIIVIGFSRVYFHVHYPSDVIGGFAIGLTYLLVCIVIIELLFAFLERRRKDYS